MSGIVRHPTEVRGHGAETAFIPAPAATQALDDEHDSTRLTRKQGVEFLNTRGYPITDRYFEKLSAPSIGGGPRVDAWFGGRALYLKRDLLAWAESRCTSTNPRLAA